MRRHHLNVRCFVDSAWASATLVEAVDAAVLFVPATSESARLVAAGEATTFSVTRILFIFIGIFEYIRIFIRNMNIGLKYSNMHESVTLTTLIRIWSR